MLLLIDGNDQERIICAAPGYTIQGLVPELGATYDPEKNSLEFRQDILQPLTKELDPKLWEEFSDSQYPGYVPKVLVIRKRGITFWFPQSTENPRVLIREIPVF